MFYPNRLSEKLTLPTSEFLSYCSLDHGEMSKLTDDITSYINCSFSNNGYTIRIISVSNSPVLSDISLTRLDLALFWVDNNAVVDQIVINLRQDIVMAELFCLKTVDEINAARQKKIDYIYSLAEREVRKEWEDHS